MLVCRLTRGGERERERERARASERKQKLERACRGKEKERERSNTICGLECAASLGGLALQAHNKPERDFGRDFATKQQPCQLQRRIERERHTHTTKDLFQAAPGLAPLPEKGKLAGGSPCSLRLLRFGSSLTPRHSTQVGDVADPVARR